MALGPSRKKCLNDTENTKPLDGVKILDLTRVLAGPFATMNLGDLGAEVIKVERPGAGDDTRAWGPPFVGSESTYFLSVNRNKKSIAVNIKDPKGVQIIKELAAVCDVFVENFVPGKLGKMGLGYEEISEIAPHIVYCSITGYGQTGPMSHRAGYDAVASAVSGLMHITGPEDGEPVRLGVAMTDLATGLYSYGAIMAGRGLYIDCNLLSSQVACLSQVAANYLIAGKEARRWGTAHGSIVPYQAFRTKDGYLVVGAGNDQQFVTVCKILHLPALINDPKYKTNNLRVQNRKELITILSARFAEEMTSTWLRLFEGSGIPYGPINSMREVFAEPQGQRSRESRRGALMRFYFPAFIKSDTFFSETGRRQASLDARCTARGMRAELLPSREPSLLLSLLGFLFFPGFCGQRPHPPAASLWVMSADALLAVLGENIYGREIANLCESFVRCRLIYSLSSAQQG
ncbi:succinyl-CoA:glutarate CoA-transferase isoform X2 [Sminthopsis crassicaudata]|uniref:succinyl-CoA:glutarate CoA-transferase isoform X2 n=1 Tax=Sminthopsis crassicaudata TaxID=9301 RepID=UPI003D69A4EA